MKKTQTIFFVNLNSRLWMRMKVKVNGNEEKSFKGLYFENDKKKWKRKITILFSSPERKMQISNSIFLPKQNQTKQKKMHWTNTMANIEKRFSFLTITIEPYFQRKKRLKIKLIINRTIHTSMVTTAAAATDFFFNIQQREYSWCTHTMREFIFNTVFFPTRISSCVKYEMKMKKFPTFCASAVGDDKINNFFFCFVSFFRGCLPCVCNILLLKCLPCSCDWFVCFLRL